MEATKYESITDNDTNNITATSSCTLNVNDAAAPALAAATNTSQPQLVASQEEPTMKKPRLRVNCLDVFRGFTIFGMTFINLGGINIYI